MAQVTIEEAMRIAIEHYQAGRMAAAEEVCGQIVAQRPNHAHALHLLGVLAFLKGQTGVAIELVGRAIAINPGNGEYHSNLGEFYRVSGQRDQAVASFRGAIERAPAHAEAHGNLGLALYEQGRLDEAIKAYHRAIALRPNYAEAHYNLGIALKDHGRPDLATAALDRAIAFKPDYAEAHNHLGTALNDQGRLDLAIAALKRAIALKPDYAEAHYNLGNALNAQGKLDLAIAAYQRAVALKPDYAEAHNNFGIALADQGQLDAALDAYRRAIELKPNLAQTHNNLGCALKDQGRLEEAIAAFHRAIELKPDYAEAHNNLGIAFADQGQLDAALDAYRRAIELKPNLAQTHNNLGCALKDQGRLEEAIAAFHRAIELSPGYAAAHSNLGSALKDQGRLEEAIAAHHRAIALKPDLAAAHNNLANVLDKQGRFDEALASCRRAATLKPDDAKVASYLLFLSHYHPNYDARAILEEHRRWARQFALPLADQIWPHHNDRLPDRMLRVGLISPSFCDSQQGQLIQPLFLNHDRMQYEFICYSDRRKPDAVTEELKTLTEEWHDTMRLSDPQVSDLVRSHRIDILVDLTLHVPNKSRMLVFARKPAPIQVSAFEMIATTGLDTIDYRLTDPYLDPPGETDGDYTERSIRLPHCFWCYRPPGETPPVAELPARRNGFVTFGCLNNVLKMNRPTRELWARVLRAVPRSRMIIHALSDFLQEETCQVFEIAGIARDRIEFVPFVPRAQYLQCHHNFDVCLDTQPYAGGTTTMDALWMGVPVVTLAGRTGVGRGGVSILSNVGLPELIAWTPEQYVDIAIGLADDRARLAELRSGLRQRMASSPLMDGKQYAANVEAAFRRIWRSWCNP